MVQEKQKEGNGTVRQTSMLQYSPMFQFQNSILHSEPYAAVVNHIEAPIATIEEGEITPQIGVTGSGTRLLPQCSKSDMQK